MTTPLPFLIPGGEPPAQTLDDHAVHALLTDDGPGYLAAVRGWLATIAAGRAHLEAPPKQVFEAPDGSDFRVMPCVTDGPWGRVESVKIVGTNRRQQQVPGQITVGTVCVLHPQEHFVTHRFDACVFSSARTGLVAALAVELLAERRGEVVVVGAGRVGYYAARYLAAVAGVARIVIADLDPTRAARCADALKAAGTGADITARARPLDDAAVAVLATTAAQPFWRLADAHAPVLAVSLGADARSQHELSPAWADAELYVDAPDALATGDLAAWSAAGMSFAPPAMLVDLCDTPPPPTARARAFVSTGAALLDNLTCAYLLQRSAASS